MDCARIKINRSCKKILQGTVQTSFEGISRRSSCGAGKEMFKKSVLHMQSSCFADETYCFFDVSVALAVVAKADVVGNNKRQLNERNEALCRKGYH